MSVPRGPRPVRTDSVYVYYRVPREREAATVSAVRALQTQWSACWPGLQCELLRRVDTGAEVTLMEVYRHRDGVDAAWQQRIEHDAAALGVKRHVEAFEACDAPPQRAC